MEKEINKLIYITNARIPTDKAHGLQIMKMCHAFAQNGVAVELVAPRRRNTIQEDPFSYYDIDQNFRITRLPTIDLILHAGTFVSWAYLLQYLTFSAFAFWYCAFKDADVFYGRHELPLLFLSFIKKRVFWEAHMDRYSHATRWLLRRVSGVITNSSGVKKFLDGKRQDVNSISLPNGVDISEFPRDRSPTELREELNLPRDKKIIAYVGRYASAGKKKGVDQIIQVFSRLSGRKKNIHLLIVGVTAEEKSELEQVIITHNISPQDFSIITFVPHTKALAYMQAADLLVMNYPNDAHHRENMSPIKLAEYMATGNPIVTSDLPAVRRVLDDNCAYFFTPEDVDAFEDAILHVLEDSGYARRLGARARERVKKYTWDVRAREALSFMIKKL